MRSRCELRAAHVAAGRARFGAGPAARPAQAEPRGAGTALPPGERLPQGTGGKEPRFGLRQQRQLEQGSQARTGPGPTPRGEGSAPRGAPAGKAPRRKAKTPLKPTFPRPRTHQAAEAAAEHPGSARPRRAHRGIARPGPAAIGARGAGPGPAPPGAPCPPQARPGPARPRFVPALEAVPPRSSLGAAAPPAATRGSHRGAVTAPPAGHGHEGGDRDGTRTREFLPNI